MNFLTPTFPGIGGSLLIAIVGIIHVLVSHGIAIGGSFFLVLLEFKSIQESNERLNQAAYYLARWFFIIATSIGALTGVGIWFTVTIFAPVAIGSLVKVFFWAWFFEWLIFMTELGLVMVYYLTWKLMPPRKHLRVGILYVVASTLTAVTISGILGYMLTSGWWVETRTFWSAFFNPTFLPQMCSRLAMAALLACTFSLFIFQLMPSFKDIRKEFFRFAGAYLLVAAPAYLLFTYTYYEMLPGRAMNVMPVALATLQFAEYAAWTKVFYFAVAGLLFLFGFIMFSTRRSFVILSIIPMLLLSAGVAQFERVREFVRRPYLVPFYLYSNGIREEEAPYLSSVGIQKYFTWAWYEVGEKKGEPVLGILKEKGEKPLGNMVFLVECSVCHTYYGVNGIFNKTILSSEESTMAFLNNYQYGYPYMPPFVGTEEEKKALAKFLTEGAAKR